MNPFHATIWPATLAQADESAAPASAPLDTSPPPAAAAEGADTDATTQAPGAPGTTNPDGTATPTNPLSSLFFPMILIIGLLFIFTMGSGRKEKKRKAELMANLNKGAKVQTVGGVLGTVVEVRDDEVLVKVDENSNTRMRFAKSAIGSVISED